MQMMGCEVWRISNTSGQHERGSKCCLVFTQRRPSLALERSSQTEELPCGMIIWKAAGVLAGGEGIMDLAVDDA